MRWDKLYFLQLLTLIGQGHYQSFRSDACSRWPGPFPIVQIGCHDVEDEVGAGAHVSMGQRGRVNYYVLQTFAHEPFIHHPWVLRRHDRIVERMIEFHIAIGIRRPIVEEPHLIHKTEYISHFSRGRIAVCRLDIMGYTICSQQVRKLLQREFFGYDPTLYIRSQRLEEHILVVDTELIG